MWMQARADRGPSPPQAWQQLVDDDARDSLHILPLSALPLETPGLQRARLIKNVRLNSVVEVFNDATAGSGQVAPSHLPMYFNSYPGEIARDLVKINRVAQIPSFDVYSLRIELRRLKIDVDECWGLQLSERRRAQLVQYMRIFTRPLIECVYGAVDVQVQSVDDLIRLFAQPDVDEARRRLRRMADRLDIGIGEIPSFLEEYGDIFLSLAYFRRCLDEIVPDVQNFLAWMEGVRASNAIRRDVRQQRLVEEVNRDLTDIITSITGRFESFDNRSKSFWQDINADSFRSIREAITAHHVTIGGVLCGLAVKMNLWKERFAHGGGPVRRLEFIKSEILPGLSYIRNLERSACAAMR